MSISKDIQQSLKKIPYELEAHGDVRIDNYYWMRDDSRSDPELISYLESENEYFNKWLDSNNIWLQRSCLLFQLKYKKNLLNLIKV